MELEWKEAITIADGNHTGEISKVEYRHEPYEYTDIFIKVDETEVELKYGCPTNLSDQSKLGILLQAFGAEAKAGTTIDPEVALVGQKVSFMTISKPSKKDKDKSFSEIVADSIKPIPAQ